MPLLTAREQEPARSAVVRPLGQKLEGQERLGGAALTQVQLDGVRRPIAGGISLYHEVKCEPTRSEEHTSELQSLMRISYAVFCLQKKKKNTTNKNKAIL